MPIVSFDHLLIVSEWMFFINVIESAFDVKFPSLNFIPGTDWNDVIKLSSKHLIHFIETTLLILLNGVIKAVPPWYDAIRHLTALNGICLFWLLNGIWRGGCDLRNYKSYDHEISPDVGIHKGARNQKKILTHLAWPVNYRPISRKSRYLKTQLLSMLTSRNFAALSILTSKINPENFRSIFQRLVILQSNL